MLERFNLLPAIQRPPIVQPQAFHYLAFRLLHSLILYHIFLHLPPLEFFLEQINLLLYALPAQISQFLAFCCGLVIGTTGRLGLVRKFTDRETGFSSGIRGGGYLILQFREPLRVLSIKTLELALDTALDVEF